MMRSEPERVTQLEGDGPHNLAVGIAPKHQLRTGTQCGAPLIVEAYRELVRAAPTKRFVYGETGWKEGGRIRPHRTHQNGLSVDFMVPVLDKDGQSVPLPTNALNRFAYDIEFDAGPGIHLGTRDTRESV